MGYVSLRSWLLVSVSLSLLGFILVTARRSLPLLLVTEVCLVGFGLDLRFCLALSLLLSLLTPASCYATLGWMLVGLLVGLERGFGLGSASGLLSFVVWLVRLLLWLVGSGLRCCFWVRVLLLSSTGLTGYSSVLVLGFGGFFWVLVSRLVARSRSSSLWKCLCMGLWLWYGCWSCASVCRSAFDAIGKLSLYGYWWCSWCLIRRWFRSSHSVSGFAVLSSSKQWEVFC